MPFRAALPATTLLVLATVPASSASGDLFPPAVLEAGGHSRLATPDEPALWPADALQGYKQRYRLWMGGYRINADISIRIDVDMNGQAWAFVKRGRGRVAIPDDPIMRYGPIVVDQDDLSDLEQRIRAAGLWRTFPQFYVRDQTDGSICAHDEDVILERLDSEGYRYAQGQLYCTLGRSQRAVVEKILAIAQLDVSIRGVR